MDTAAQPSVGTAATAAPRQWGGGHDEPITAGVAPANNCTVKAAAVPARSDQHRRTGGQGVRAMTNVAAAQLIPSGTQPGLQRARRQRSTGRGTGDGDGHPVR